ncbi:MAG: hypothetical protein KDE35_04815 [Geminicoccaceae bacterium]|nr:hypothetical protein [Geminicoccaceae bacterium]
MSEPPTPFRTPALTIFAWSIGACFLVVLALAGLALLADAGGSWMPYVYAIVGCLLLAPGSALYLHLEWHRIRSDQVNRATLVAGATPVIFLLMALPLAFLVYVFGGSGAG